MLALRAAGAGGAARLQQGLEAIERAAVNTSNTDPMPPPPVDRQAKPARARHAVTTHGSVTCRLHTRHTGHNACDAPRQATRGVCGCMCMRRVCCCLFMRRTGRAGATGRTAVSH